MTVLPPIAIQPLWRGVGSTRQLDFHLLPTWVDGGDESRVLVATGGLGSSGNFWVSRCSSFLGVLTGDVVEAAVDVVGADGLVLYTRSMHKETMGIYDAWDHQDIGMLVTGLTVTLTCRVTGLNRTGLLKAYFEGLVRLTMEDPA